MLNWPGLFVYHKQWHLLRCEQALLSSHLHEWYSYSILLFPRNVSLQIEPLMSMYAMEFAVEEINSSPSILPGVRLSYRILDSCGRHPWALLGAFSLVGGDSSTCNSTAGLPSSHVLVSPRRDRRGTQCELFVPNAQLIDCHIGEFVEMSFLLVYNASIRGPVCPCDHWRWCIPISHDPVEDPCSSVHTYGEFHHR